MSALDVYIVLGCGNLEELRWRTEKTINLCENLEEPYILIMSGTPKEINLMNTEFQVLTKYI
jgi:hypothetical protein